MPKIGYKELKFRSLPSARRRQKAMREAFGYKPSIFRIKPPKGKAYYVIVKPHGLKKIK